MNRNLTGSASRRRPSLYLESPRLPGLRSGHLADVAAQFLEASQVVSLGLGRIHAVEVIGAQIRERRVVSQDVVRNHQNAVRDGDGGAFGAASFADPSV